MKKIVLVLVLAAVVAAGSAFAEHPDGWGVGVGAKFGDSWGDYSDAGADLSLFLKAPQLPIYWGITADLFNMGDNPSEFGLGLTGDYYIFDKWLVPDIKLGWFLGVGGYFNFYRYGYDSPYTNADWSGMLFDFGVRVPVGLTWQPIDFLEVFLDIAPAVGFYYQSWDYPDYFAYNNLDDSDMGLGGGWHGEFGVRFWF